LQAKRLLRYAFDRFQSDTLFNLLLGTRLMRTAASIVYFHRKGVFDPPEPASHDAADQEASLDNSAQSPRTDGN